MNSFGTLFTVHIIQIILSFLMFPELYSSCSVFFRRSLVVGCLLHSTETKNAEETFDQQRLNFYFDGWLHIRREINLGCSSHVMSIFVIESQSALKGIISLSSPGLLLSNSWPPCTGCYCWRVSQHFIIHDLSQR